MKKDIFICPDCNCDLEFKEEKYFYCNICKYKFQLKEDILILIKLL